MMEIGLSHTISLPLMTLVLKILLIPLHTLTYYSIDDAYTVIIKLGLGALLCKIDLKDPFCLMPVQASDWNILGKFGNRNFMQIHVYHLDLNQHPTLIVFQLHYIGM